MIDILQVEDSGAGTAVAVWTNINKAHRSNRLPMFAPKVGRMSENGEVNCWEYGATGWEYGLTSYCDCVR